MKLSVCMIVGNCADTLEPCFQSLETIADELCVVVTKNDDDTLDVVKRHIDLIGGHVSERYDMIDEDGDMISFADARNASFELATGDMILWIDSDDILVNPEGFREEVERQFGLNTDHIIMHYDYEQDDQGRSTTAQERERVLRRGYHNWISFLHEVAVPKRHCNVSRIDKEMSYIKHRNPKSDDPARSKRNLDILMKHLKNDGSLETRMKMYVGNALVDLGRSGEAVKWYEDYLEESEWDEERLHVMHRLFNVFRETNPDVAEMYSAKMYRLDRRNAITHICMAQTSLNRGRWHDALWDVESFKRAKKASTVTIYNPFGLEYIPLSISQKCFLNLGMYEEAFKVTQAMSKITPELQEKHDFNLKAIKEKILSRKKLQRKLEEFDELENEEERSEYVNRFVKGDLQHYDEFKKYLKKERPDGKRVCAIYCGNDQTSSWGPSSIEKGIGGSEEAVINISKELAMLGWTVEVYANVEEEGCFNGVHWYQATASNPNDLVDLCIVWRGHRYVEYAPKGRVTWLWLHDLQGGQEAYYVDVNDKYDNYLFLSEFHAKDAPWVEKDKIFLTTNGVDPKMMKSGQNNPKKVIYASSPDRGLDNLLKDWPDVHAATGAELHVYYGFNKYYDKRYEKNRKMMDFKRWVLSTCEADPSIHYHGSVGQTELGEAMADSGIWSYPTQFGEISCITAMKMQACGAVPVCTDYGALKETVMFGKKIASSEDTSYDKEEYKKALIEAINDEDWQKNIREEMVRAARLKFGWKGVAQKWNKKFSQVHSDQLKAVAS